MEKTVKSKGPKVDKNGFIHSLHIKTEGKVEMQGENYAEPTIPLQVSTAARSQRHPMCQQWGMDGANDHAVPDGIQKESVCVCVWGIHLLLVEQRANTELSCRKPWDVV